MSELDQLIRLQRENEKLQKEVVYWREANDDARLELANLKAQIGWTSVEDRLPENEDQDFNGRYITLKLFGFPGEKKPYLDVTPYNEHAKKFNQGGNLTNEGIILWATHPPLPEPPEPNSSKSEGEDSES